MSRKAGHASPASERRRGVDLGTQVVGVGALATLLVLIGFGALAWANVDARYELQEATALLIEEERVSNRIAHAVIRQAANASALGERGSPLGEAEFAAASQEVYELLREYLFRDLSPRERLLVERMGEDHQRLEVEAARASNLFDRGEYAQADRARDQMVVHVLSLLEAMDEFLDIHEEGLNALAREQDAAFRLIYLIGGAVALLFLSGTILLFWLFRTRIARPLQVLAAATEKIGTGQLDVRVPEPPEPELHTLATGFNRMAENLKRATAALEHRNEELSTALDQVSEAQAELIQAEKLTAMGRMTAGLAHELNNPLASIVGFSQLLAEHLEKQGDDVGDEVQEEILGPILREASRAQHLVLSFLNFARRPEAAMGAVPLAQVIGVVQALRDPAFRQKGLTLVVEEIPECDVWAEAQMLQGVVLNVVNNALDAMAPVGEGRLVVSARLMGDDVDLRF
ncbi:MAG: histidine kinase dimerization/phospho-acceptor domain-containing protein, partial [Gemmatimonadota bacterium]